MGKGGSGQDDAPVREARENYPRNIGDEVIGLPVEGDIPEALLVPVGEGLAEGVTAVNVAGYGEDCEWVTASSAWGENIQVELSGRDEDIDVSSLFENVAWNASTGVFSSFVATTLWMKQCVNKKDFLWNLITKIESKEADAQLYSVRVFIDGEWRQVIVNDKVPVKDGKAICACLVVDTTEGDETGQKTCYLWPMLLEKTFLYLSHSTNHGCPKCDPYSLFNHWGCLEDSTGPLDSTPKDISWRLLRKPREANYYFKSWEHFQLAKTEANANDDPETLALYEAAEKEAMEKKIAFEAQQLELEAAAAAGATEEGEQASKETTEESTEETKKKGSKKKKKRKQKSKGFVPFNQVSFNYAMERYNSALEKATQYLGQRRDMVDVVTVGNELVKVECKVLHKEEELRQNQGEHETERNQSAKKEDKKKNEATAAAVSAEVTDEESKTQKTIERIIDIGNSEWVLQERALLPNARYIVCEEYEGSVRLCGLLGVLGGSVDWSVKETFWITKQVFEELQTLRWKSFTENAHSTTLHDHCAPDFSRTSRANCSALLISCKSQEKEEENKTSSDLGNVTVTIQFSADAAAENHTAVLKLDRMNVTENLIESNPLYKLESEPLKEVVCDTSRGVSTFQVELNPSVEVLVIQGNAPMGGSITFIAEDDSVESLQILPLLEARKRLLESVGSSPILETAAAEFRATPSCDWQIIGRFRIEADAEEFVLCGSIEYQDARFAQYVSILKVDNSTGVTQRVDSGRYSLHNGQWIPPVKSFSDTQDIVLVVNAPSDQDLPANSYTLHLSLEGASLTELVQMEPSSCCLSFEGRYLPNRHCILFRDYLENIPSCTSLRLVLASPDPDKPIPEFTLQVIAQDIEAQASSGRIGINDRVLAAVSSNNSVADLHWTPPDGYVLDPSKHFYVLQAIVTDSECAGEEPYWDETQRPEDKLRNATDAFTNQPETNWILYVSASSGTFDLRRETGWEAAVRNMQKCWEDACPGRKESGSKLREAFITGAKVASASERDLYRAQLSDEAELRADEKGAFIVERCPAPRTEDERFCLDKFAKPLVKNLRVNEEGKGEKKDGNEEALISGTVRDSRREEMRKWFVNLQ